MSNRIQDVDLTETLAEEYEKDYEENPQEIFTFDQMKELLVAFKEVQEAYVNNCCTPVCNDCMNFFNQKIADRITGLLYKDDIYYHNDRDLLNKPKRYLTFQAALQRAVIRKLRKQLFQERMEHALTKNKMANRDKKLKSLERRTMSCGRKGR